MVTSSTLMLMLPTAMYFCSSASPLVGVEVETEDKRLSY